MRISLIYVKCCELQQNGRSAGLPLLCEGSIAKSGQVVAIGWNAKRGSSVRSLPARWNAQQESSVRNISARWNAQPGSGVRIKETSKFLALHFLEWEHIYIF